MPGMSHDAVSLQTIQYRIAELGDIGELVTLRGRFLEEANGKPVHGELMCAIRRTFLKHMQQGVMVSWLATAANRIVGTGSITFWEKLPNASSPNGLCGYIANMYTLPEFRGRGIASTIFGKLVEEARRREVRSLSLHALPAGAGIYRKAGFAFSEDAMGMGL
jgi:GNAT superfamily N-acetyltransferase